MSKSIKIATLGIAALSAAALPLAGSAHAENTATGNPIIDTVKTEITESCSFSGTANTTTVTPNSSATNTNAFTVNCNTDTGWKVLARGVNGTSSPTASTDMMHTNNTDKIATAKSGNGWGFSIAKEASTGAGEIVSGYGERNTVPSSATAILTGTPTASTAFKATYYVNVPTNQAAGVYTGYVEYTLTNAAS